MTKAKYILVVKVSEARTEYYTDESGDYDQEYCRQVWSTRLEEVMVDKGIRKAIDEHNYGDEDLSVSVVFVLDAKTHKVLIDYTEDWRPDPFRFMDDDDKKAYLQAIDGCRKDRQRREESALCMIESKLGELKHPCMFCGEPTIFATEEGYCCEECIKKPMGD